MVFGNLLFGSSDKKRKERREEEETEEYKARIKAYNDALQQRRLENARRKGIEDADRIANKKPFYQRVMGIGSAIVRDLSAPPPKGSGSMFSTNPDALFTWNDEEPKRVKRKRRRKKK